jgi:sugar (pentulose or hexulose) kinase
MSGHPTTFVGVDLGTSALKVVAVSTDGALLGTARREYETHRPEPAAAEQDPRHWWSALESALKGLAHDVPPASWAGLGLSAMLPTLVELDADDVPVGPAITWEDGRAEFDAEVFLDAVGADEVYRITGQRLDGRYLAPMHARLRRLGRHGAKVAGAKDVLFAHLTGELVTDPSTAAGTGVFDLTTECWSPELVSAAGIVGLPEVRASATALPLSSTLSDGWGLPRGLPVVLGAADSVLGATGVGATAHGDVAVIAGTSAIVLGVSDTALRDRDRRYLVTPLAGVGWGLEMDLLAMGSAFDGIAELLGLANPAALMAVAELVSPDDAPVFLPYLSPGEQGALWDPDLTGTLHGLRLGMEAGHVGRALLTGVVTELRRCTEVLAETTGRRGPLLLGGGAAASPLMWQELADATGREVRVDPSTNDHSALGAALFAATSLGAPIPRPTKTIDVAPRPDRSDWWAETALRHDALRMTLNHTTLNHTTLNQDSP